MSTYSSVKREVNPYADHETEWCEAVQAEVDVNMLTLVEWLNWRGWVTLHCCEGDPAEQVKRNRTGWAYIHFRHASDMEDAVNELAVIALHAGHGELAERMRQVWGSEKGSPRDEWHYEVSWRPTPTYCWGSELLRQVLTATVRFSHEDALLVRDMLTA